MSEADRIRREQELKSAMMDAEQPVPMAGYPNVNPHGYSPSQYYQTLLSTGLPKEGAKQKVYDMMKEANMQEFNTSGGHNVVWPAMEGEY